MPLPGKVKKCYRVKKTTISKVSLNGLDTIGLCVCSHMLCKLNSCLYSAYLFLITNVYRFHSHQWSSRLQRSKIVQKSICAGAPLDSTVGAYSAPPVPLAGREEASDLQASARHLPSPGKNAVGALVFNVLFLSISDKN